MESFAAQQSAPESWLDINEKCDYEALSITKVSEHTRAYIKIQDGCNQFCSYCIIPYARGRVRSRKPEDILSEVSALARAGYKEIVLTGIHISSYGKDFAEKIDETESTEEKLTGGGDALIFLVEKLAAIEGIERIRFGSLEPGIITEDFVRRLAKLPEVCPHFHLSLQSGCEATLKRMNRHYTPSDVICSKSILTGRPLRRMSSLVFRERLMKNLLRQKAFLNRFILPKCIFLNIRRERGQGPQSCRNRWMSG